MKRHKIRTWISEAIRDKEARSSRRAAPRGSARIPAHEFRTLMRKTRDHCECTGEWVCTENTLKFLDDIGALRVPYVPVTRGSEPSLPVAGSVMLMDCEGCWTHSIPIEYCEGDDCPLCGSSMLMEQGDLFEADVWGGGHNRAYAPRQPRPHNGPGKAAAEEIVIAWSRLRDVCCHRRLHCVCGYRGSRPGGCRRDRCPLANAKVEAPK